MVKLIVAAALNLSFVVTSGCQSLVESVLEKPQVQFHSVAVRDATKDGATAVIAIDVTNPNGITLTVDELTYSLELGGREVAKSEVKQFAKLQANSTSRVEIPVPFKYSQVFSSVMDLISNGTAAYKVRGEARVGLFTLPFDHVGDLKLR